MELEKYLITLEEEKQYPSFVLDALRNFDYNEINLQLILFLVKYICHSMDDGPTCSSCVRIACLHVHDLHQPPPAIQASNMITASTLHRATVGSEALNCMYGDKE